MLTMIVDPGLAALLPAPWQRKLKVACNRMVQAVAKQEGAAYLEATLRLCDDATIHTLNRNFRRKDKPTDVLAFAQREALPRPQRKAWPSLGDIVISLPTARAQTKAPRTMAKVYAEVLFLASHGLCHLIGYDHQTDAQEAEMNARMAGLREMGLARGPVRAA